MQSVNEVNFGGEDRFRVTVMAQPNRCAEAEKNSSLVKPDETNMGLGVGRFGIVKRFDATKLPHLFGCLLRFA
jgi:hypothetical protein